MKNYSVQLQIAGAALIAAAFCSMAIAQESVYKAPTAADWTALAKLPDFSGVWERAGVGGGGGLTNAAGQRAPRGAATPRGAAAGQRRGGARGRGAPAGPAFTPKYEAMRLAAVRQAAEDTEAANCLPPGMPTIMTQPYPMEFLLTPGKVTIVIEAYTQVRHIYTDGRKLPDNPDPKFFGTSIGHWEDDTLVAETIGFNDRVQLARGVPHGDQMKIVERFRLTDPDTMTIETTITDPEVLTQPYVTTSLLKRHRNWTISEYVCEENNRNYVDATGKAGINLTIPGAPKKD